MNNAIDDFCEEIRKGDAHTRALEELRCHRAALLEQEGRLFFDELRRAVKDALPAVTAWLGLRTADVWYAEGKNSFEITNQSSYPVIAVRVEYMIKRILLRTTRRQRPNLRLAPEDAQTSIEFCVRSDDELYLCHEGAVMSGTDEGVKLVLRPLFHARGHALPLG